MKRLLLIIVIALSMNYVLALTAGDIAIIAVNTDVTKNMVFVALAEIPANTTISFSDNAWNATTGVWRTGEGTISWSNTSVTAVGSIVTITLGTTYSASLGSVNTVTDFNLSASGDQILAYEGTTAPTSNSDATWLFGFSIESFAWGNNSNTSDIPTALLGSSVAMTTSTTETDNAYFANGSTSQSAVSVSGSKSELLAMFTNSSLYFKSDAGPLTPPSYSITVNTGGNPVASTPAFSPGGASYYSTVDVSISCSTEGSTVYYTTNGTDPTNESNVYSTPISVSSTTTIKAIAYATGYDPSAIATAEYTFPTLTDVSTIAELRAGATDGTVYRLTGESIITFKHTTGNQKWIEDSTAAIMIYDPSGKITTNYNIGDGIENIVGTLALYNQLLEFIPVLDPGMPTSTDNPVIPTVRTLASLTSADQSKLILVENVTLGSTGTFSTSAQNINATQDVTTLTLRTFANTDYSGTTIPTTPQNIICLVGQFNSAIQISPRFLADFASAFDYPNGTTVGTVTVTGGNANDSANQTIPEINNSSFTPSYQNVFNLIGSGPWTLTFDSTAPHGAYYQNGNWNSVVGNGSQIVMNISANKDLDLPVVLGDQDPTLPVELSSFTATLSAQNLVSLMWVTQSETGVTGYYIYRGIDTNASTAQIVSPLITATNTSTTQSYVYVDSEIFETGTYYYWLQNVDIDGTTDFHGPIRLDYVAGQNNGTPNIPVVTELKNVYPNPFNPIAFISYSLAENNPVAIKIYNNRGQLVRVLDNAPATAGNHRIEWNGMDNSGNACSTGLYLVRMTAGNKTFTQKVVLVK